MSTDLILNILVAAVAINALFGARYNIDSRRLKAIDYGAPYVISALFTAATMLTLWTWLAFETGHWQFAAIIGIPLLVTVGSLAASPKVTAIKR